MRRALLLLLCVLVVTAATAVRAQDQPVSLRFELDADEVLLGDSFGCRIIVDGVEDAQGPGPAGFGKDFDTRFVGGSPARRSSMTVVNGRVSRHEEVSYTLAYDVRPRRAGTLTIPALTVTAGGERLQTEPRRVEVLGPRPSDTAELELSFRPERVYVEQPVEFVLTVRLRRALVGDEWFDGDPWYPNRPPELRIPWFQALDGFATGDPQGFMRSLVAPAGQSGFRVNGLATSSIFGEARALRFRLKRLEKSQRRAETFEYTLRKRMVPLQHGTLEIPVSTLVGDTLQTLVRRRGELHAQDTETVFVAHAPVSLDVLPVPDAGRPPSYVHAVGRYSVSATATPTRLKVGDPVTLRLRVEGRDGLDRVQPPRIDRQADIAKDFAVGEGEELDPEGGAAIFAYTLRPRRSEIDRIPPIEFASFDPERVEFVTASTRPIALTVEKAVAVSASEVEMAGGGPARASTPGEELHGGLLGNYGVEEALRDESFAPLELLLSWLLLGLPPLFYVAVAVATWRRRATGADPQRRRATRALSVAEERIAEARAALSKGDERAATSATHRALAGFVADRAGLVSAGLTAGDVADHFASHEIATREAESLVTALRECEAARYGGAPADLPTTLDAARDWLRALARELLA